MIRSTLIIALLILAGRITGFGREWMLSARWGASETSDIVVVLMTLPDLLVSLLLGGAFTAAAVPEFSALTKRDASSFLWQLIFVIGIAFTSLAIVLGIYGFDLLHALAPGMSEHLIRAHIFDVRLVLIAIPLTAMSGIVVAYLNAHKRFITGASGTLIFNLCLLAAMGLSSIDNIGYWIAAGIVAGAGIRLASQGLEMYGLPANPDFSRWLINKAFLARFIGAFSFVSILAILPALARAFSSQIEPGALALFNYAYKLVELPLGVVISAIAIVLLPHLSAGLGPDTTRRDAATEQISNSLRYTFMLSLAIAIPACVFSQTLVDCIYFNGDFSAEQRHLLGQLTAIGFIALPLQGLLPIYSSAFAADRHTKALVWSGLSMPIIFCLLDYLAPFGERMPGVMAAYTMTHVIVAIQLTLIAKRRFGSAMLKSATKQWPSVLGWPVVLCLLACSIGRASAQSTGQSLAAMVIAFGIFMLALVQTDEVLRQHVYARLNRMRAR